MQAVSPKPTSQMPDREPLKVPLHKNPKYDKRGTHIKWHVRMAGTYHGSITWGLYYGDPQAPMAGRYHDKGVGPVEKRRLWRIAGFLNERGQKPVKATCYSDVGEGKRGSLARSLGNYSRGEDGKLL